MHFYIIKENLYRKHTRARVQDYELDTTGLRTNYRKSKKKKLIQKIEKKKIACLCQLIFINITNLAIHYCGSTKFDKITITIIHNIK